MPLSELQSVLDAHLGAQSRRVLTGWPVEKVRTLLADAGRGRDAQSAIEAEVRGLLRLVGVPDPDQAVLADGVLDLIGPEREALVDRSVLPTLFQAYARAVGRIAAAEAGIVRDVVTEAPGDERADTLDRLLQALLPLADQGFESLHRAFLHEALRTDLSEPDTETMTVAMVDLVGSTRYLARHDAPDLGGLVDALFEAGQLATAERDAHVVKHVGDGLFLAGRNTPDVAGAALAVTAWLERALPLRARGGVAHGRVVERAGDIFGLPVNLAQIVTKAARPGRVLATEDAAARLPASARNRLRTVDLPHPAVGPTRVATLRPPATQATG